MMSQVAIGLDGAHARNFIHRDLKPDNLFLCGTREGDIVKLLDFGSVKDQSGSRKKLTMLGTTIGSPYYMAPEQAQGLETHRSPRRRVRARAPLAYECMTGEVPFAGNNGPSILLAILTKDPVPPTAEGQAAGKYPVPPTLDEVMEEALAKNPNIRTKSAGALADAVGHAYGLEGDHLAWARMPRRPSGGADRVQRPRVMAAQVAALGVAGRSVRGGGRSLRGAAATPTGRPGAARLPAPCRLWGLRAGTAGDGSGVPGRARGRHGRRGRGARGQAWLLPVVVGLVALLVGGAITLVVMMH